VPSGDEDEVGYGYTDIISLNQGLAVDILSDIGKGLAKIGDLVTMKLNLKTSFSISNSEIVDCAFQVIPDSIEVKIDNTIVPHVFRPSICEVQIDVADAGRANSRVLISYSYLQN
ncbi:MAG: hypothetical protein KDD35_13230, partial [Bdellovibrionales bacterium]|nr:hypothetical protein [Bdellovibrionales bacterium]